jgi:RNA polymerase sigma-70 factor (ECF subfamily)
MIDIRKAQLDDYSDDILVEASRRGDKHAYSMLVKRHYRYVFAVCLGMLANVHDAEDIAQDAMLKGFLKIRRLHRSERFDPWVLRIARNLCVDYLRRKKHAKAFAEQIRNQSTGASDESGNLHEAIDQLSQEYRVPLMMYYFDNRSAKTIAEKLNISHSGACHKIRAARKKLYDLLKETQK